MKKSPSLPVPQTSMLLGAAALAACGQFFLIQQDKPWTLVPGLLLYALAGRLWVKVLGGFEYKKETPLPPAREAIFLLLIGLLALGFRLFRSGDFPTGIFTDEACAGWGGMMISREHYPFLAHLKQIIIFDPSLAYWAALWYSFFEPSQASFLLFSVAIALLAFPFLYWTFRQLAGARTALLALFILAVMRWHVTYSRTGHPAAEFLLYLFGSLAFWIAGWRTGKSLFFIPAALLMAGGFYSYQGFFASLLLPPLYFGVEWKRGEWKVQRQWRAFGTAFAAGLAGGWPIYRLILSNGGFGDPREKILYPLKGGMEGIGALLGHFGEMAMMFNRKGDGWALHNLPFHRALDDVTGVLWILGLCLALSRLRERRNIYAVLGLAVMSLPAFLSTNPAGASRMMGTAPFAALLAASALAAAASWFQKKGVRAFAAVLGALLALMAFQNFDVYFNHQAKDPDCRRVDCPAETAVGNALRRNGHSLDYYLAPAFFGHYTVMFLGFHERDFTHELDLPESLALPGTGPGRDVLFALSEGQTGVLDLLREFYPGGSTESLKDPLEETVVYFYRVPASAVALGKVKAEKFLSSPFGLEGIYSLSWRAELSPPLRHRDMLLNFTHHNDFAFRQFPPLAVHWKGWLDVPAAGNYRFLVLTTDSGNMSLDGKPVLTEGNRESAAMALRKGLHPIEAGFQKAAGVQAAFSLLWKKPGDEKYEVVPATALRRDARGPQRR